MGFATAAMFGRVGRVCASNVSAHRGGWSDRLAGALAWWRALLRCPIYRRREHGDQRPVVLGW
eukprot:987854-Pyramimonas_sp.AAC.1